MVNDIIKSAIKLHCWNRLVKAEQFYSFVLMKKKIQEKKCVSRGLKD